MESQHTTSVMYEHTQIGYLALIGLALGLLMQTANFVDELRKRSRRAWVCLPGMAVQIALACVFTSLTVQVTRESLSVSFRRGCLRRKVDLADVVRGEQVVVPWYHGWGLRLTPKGRLYSVQGRHAVRLELANGRGLTIGTDEPEQLAAAIESARLPAGAET